MALHIDHNALTTTTSLSFVHRPTSAVWCRCKALLPYYKMTELVSSICNGIKIRWHRLEGNILLFWCYLRIAKDNHEWHSRWDDWIECLGMFWLSISKVGFVIFVRIFALFIRLRLTFFAHCLLVFVWQIDRLEALVHERNAIIYQPTMMLHWRRCILNSGECKMAVHHVSNK